MRANNVSVVISSSVCESAAALTARPGRAIERAWPTISSLPRQPPLSALSAAVVPTEPSGVLRPAQGDCVDAGLSANVGDFPEPHVQPGPEDLHGAVPEGLSPSAVDVVLGNPADHVVAQSPDAGWQVFAPTTLSLTTLPLGVATIDVGSFDEIEVIAGAEVAEWVRFGSVRFRSGLTSDAPRASAPLDAATLFRDWINGRASELEGFQIQPLHSGWTRLDSADGGVAFGWPAPSASYPGGFYIQVLSAETDGAEWWIGEFRTSGC